MGTSTAEVLGAVTCLWTALVPLPGYLALLRNLRNLDEAGMPDDVVASAAARLADPEQVRRSRVFSSGWPAGH